MKRVGNEIRVENKTFKAKIGTTNKIEKKTFYIECSAYLSPIEAEKKYDTIIYDLKKEIKRQFISYLKEDNIFSDNSLFSFDISVPRIKFGKKTKLSLCFFIKIKNPNQHLLYDIQNRLKALFNFLSSDIEDMANDYGFSLTLKK